MLNIRPFTYTYCSLTFLNSQTGWKYLDLKIWLYKWSTGGFEHELMWRKSLCWKVIENFPASSSFVWLWKPLAVWINWAVIVLMPSLVRAALEKWREGGCAIVVFGEKTKVLQAVTLCMWGDWVLKAHKWDLSWQHKRNLTPAALCSGICLCEKQMAN